MKYDRVKEEVEKLGVPDLKRLGAELDVEVAGILRRALDNRALEQGHA